MFDTIIQYILISIFGWLAINYVIGKYFYKADEDEEEQPILDDNWTFPINLEYNDQMWYAWDSEGTFISQSASKDQLLTDILNRFDIAPKRLVIKNEKRIDGPKSTAPVQSKRKRNSKEQL